MKAPLLTFCLLLLVSIARPQLITVKENLEKIGTGINNALVVDIPETDKDDVGRAWRKLMDGAGAKVSGRSEITALHVKIPSITLDTLTVYTNLDQKDGYVHMVSAFLIRGVFLTSTNNNGNYREAERVVYNFAVDQARNAVQKKVDKEKKTLSKLEKDLMNLDEENKSLSKSIDDYTKRIQDAQKTIQDNERQKIKVSKDIGDQRAVLETMQKKLWDIK